MNLTEKATAAGLIEGDGCIAISQHGKRQGLQASVSFSNTDARLVAWLHERWPGRVGLSRRYRNRHGMAEVWRWDIRGDRAATFLLDILPYLISKAEQARLALTFIATLRPRCRAPAGIDRETRSVREALAVACAAEKRAPYIIGESPEPEEI